MKKCLYCPFAAITYGFEITTVYCMMPVCIRKFDRKMFDIRPKKLSENTKPQIGKKRKGDKNDL